jgi:hypothetical protein
MRYAILALALACGAATAQPVDPRYVGPPARDADGSIKRSSYQKALFARMYPCPAKGEVTSACPGWRIDHVIPMACGGVDAPVNMQWLPVAIKSCSLKTGVPCKDRWERTVYQTKIKCAK